MTDTTELKGIVAGLDEETYHAHPALSSTGARALLESPARFQWNRTHPRTAKKEFDLGSAVHSKVLGTGYGVVEIPADKLGKNGALSTDAAKLFVEQTRAAGKIPLKAAEIATIATVAEAVLAHPTARALLEQEGIPEASVFSTDRMTEVDTRARFDFLPTNAKGRTVASDLKSTARLASPAVFTRAVADHGYHVQHAWYRDSYAEATGDWEMEMVFIAVELEPPYLVAVHQLDTDYVDMGMAKARRARELFREYTDAGVWPGYPNEIQLLHPPMYAIYEFQENYAS